LLASSPKPDTPDSTEQVHLIEYQLKETTRRINAISDQNVQEIAELKHKRHLANSDLTAVRQFRSDLEQELDLVHSKIDFLTNPLVVANCETARSPHLANGVETLYNISEMN
jgi:septation ring formation regulator EzrA